MNWTYSAYACKYLNVSVLATSYIISHFYHIRRLIGNLVEVKVL
jgi:hypothetical protein